MSPRGERLRFVPLGCDSSPWVAIRPHGLRFVPMGCVSSPWVAFRPKTKGDETQPRHEGFFGRCEATLFQQTVKDNNTVNYIIQSIDLRRGNIMLFTGTFSINPYQHIKLNEMYEKIYRGMYSLLWQNDASELKIKRNARKILIKTKMNTLVRQIFELVPARSMSLVDPL